jgi:hypothetical protein
MTIIQGRQAATISRQEATQELRVALIQLHARHPDSQYHSGGATNKYAASAGSDQLKELERD